MLKSTEIRDSSNTYSSRLKKIFFVKIYAFGWRMRFFTISESKTRKKSKILLKGYSIG